MRSKALAPFLTRQMLWELHELATAYGQRPSAFLMLDPNDPAAFDLDRAVLRFAQSYEARRRKTKRVKPGKDDGKIEVPFYTPEENAAYLGLDVTPLANGVASILPDQVPPDIERWLAAFDAAEPVA